MLALGQVIVEQLELADRGLVLDRWLAHHLAELIVAAQTGAGPAKVEAEQRAVDLIMKLWLHRRALPEPVDPLGGYRKAITVLERLMPEADPWARYHRGGPFEDLLHEMFDVLRRVIFGGVLLTQITRPRPISEPEAEALEAEEAHLLSVLEGWEPFLDLGPPRPKFMVEIRSADAVDETEPPAEADEDDWESLSPEDQARRAERSLHSAITANLERLQSNLDALLERWRETCAHSDSNDSEEAED